MARHLTDRRWTDHDHASRFYPGRRITIGGVLRQHGPGRHRARGWLVTLDGHDVVLPDGRVIHNIPDFAVFIPLAVI